VRGKSGEPVILVMQKYQCFKQFLGSENITGTTKGIDLWVPFNQPTKVLKQEGSKYSAPKFCLDLRPYSQNTVHILLSRLGTVASFAILIPLRPKYSKSYFGKNVTCRIQEKYF
jgi:hypothetical protein